MHLLLVEDDPALGRMVSRGLEANGFQVRWAKDGDAAFDLASAGAFDVMIVDVMLPGLDGFTLLRELRQIGVRTPALCLSARTSVQDRVAGLDAGADDYLAKPFEFAELLARLRALLRRPPSLVRQDMLVAGNLRCEPAEHTVTVAGAAVDVPPREFDLLEYLLRNPGRTLTRDLIVDRVWGAAAAPRANVADATASRLRRRLLAAGWNGGIVAVPGLGYRMDVPAGERMP